MNDLPWREPSWGDVSVIVNTYDKPKKQDWETILLVTLPLVGLGILLLLGYLDFPF